MGRPNYAFALMRSLGIGVSTSNIEKIPVADANFFGTDTDGDGVSDALEDAFGTDKNNPDSDNDGFNDKIEVLAGFNPKGTGRYPIDNAFANTQKGKILLQVQANGEAWYINPVDGKRYFLGRPADAFALMRSLGLGITDADLNQIPSAIAALVNCGSDENVLMNIFQNACLLLLRGVYLIFYKPNMKFWRGTDLTVEF